MGEMRGWVGWFRCRLKTSLNFILRTGKSQVDVGEGARVWGPFCRCESCTLSQDLPALGCEAKMNSLPLTDCPGRWDKWVSGRGREVSTTEQSEVRAWSSPPLTLFSESHPTQLLNPLNQWWSQISSWPGFLTWCPSNYQCNSSRTHALPQPRAQLTGQMFGGGHGDGLERLLRFSKRK